MARIKDAPVQEAASQAAPASVATQAPQHDPYGAVSQVEGVPELAGTARGQAVYPTLPHPQSPYFLVHWPDRWHVMHGRLVPALSRLSATPGANGVDRSPSGKPQMAFALAEVEAKGGKVIPWDVDGPGRSYLVPVKLGEGRHRKTNQPVDILSWHSRWETLYPGSGAIDSNEVAYAEWCESLVTRGVVAPPRPYVLERLASSLRVLIGRHKGKGQGNGPLVGKYEADLRVVEAAQSKARTHLQPVASVQADPANELD
jgi:hypothetical protein